MRYRDDPCKMFFLSGPHPPSLHVQYLSLEAWKVIVHIVTDNKARIMYHPPTATFLWQTPRLVYIETQP